MPRRSLHRYVPDGNFNELVNSVIGISIEEPLRSINEPARTTVLRKSNQIFTASRRQLARVQRRDTVTVEGGESEAQRNEPAFAEIRASQRKSEVNMAEEMKETTQRVEEAGRRTMLMTEFREIDESEDPSLHRNSVRLLPTLSKHTSEGPGRKPFFDEFFIIGVSPETISMVNERRTHLRPETLWSYPGVLRNNCERRRSVKDFCFPNGVGVKELDLKNELN